MQERVVNITNEKDIQNFYKKLPGFVRFHDKDTLKLNILSKIEGTIVGELVMLEKAFNEKNKKQRLEFVYDQTCKLLDQYCQKENPCQFCASCCIAQDFYCDKIKKNGCCGNCSYLKEKTCSIQSLGCKLFFCRHLRKQGKMKTLNDISISKYFFSWKQKRLAPYLLFKTKEESLEILAKNSVLSFLFYQTSDTFRY